MKNLGAYSLLLLPLTMNAIAAEPAKPVDATVDTLQEAFTDGKFNAEFRYRYEDVNQDGINGDAYANTLRTRLRYSTAIWNGFSGVVEWDNVTMLGDDNYNDTRNEQISYPLVIDPEGSAINQAYLKYTAPDKSSIIAGRQRVNIENQRFIGSVGWRQNEQTLDGALLEYKGIDKFTATYGYFITVNRIFGPHKGPLIASPANELDSDVQVLNLKYALNDMFAVTAYGYFLDLDELKSASSQTTGLRFTGKIPVSDFKLSYTAEYANQSDYAGNPAEYDADYGLAEIGFGNSTWEALAGYELLGSDDGKFSVQTPLATLHKFQGWADKFLVTPNSGIADTYTGANAKFYDYSLSAVAHEYETDEGNDDLGNEIDIQLSRTFEKKYTITVKYADYHSGDVSAYTDTSKFWVMAEAKF